MGIGFLSGKEARLYVGGRGCAVLFALCFTLATLLLRDFCRKQHCRDAESLCRALSKRSEILNFLLTLCCLACSVTVLAGADEVLGALLTPLPLPVYAFAACCVACVLTLCNMRVMKGLNALTLLLAVALLLLAGGHLAGEASGNSPELRSNWSAVSDMGLSYDFNAGRHLAGESVVRPVLYALYSVTVCAGLTARLGSNATARQNIVVSLCSGGILLGLVLWILPMSQADAPLPLLCALETLPERIFAAVVLLLAAVTGLAANILPVSEYLYRAVPDKTLSTMLALVLALLLSLPGLDAVMSVGYAAVAAVGALLLALAAKKIKRQRKKSDEFPKKRATIYKNERETTKGLKNDH